MVQAAHLGDADHPSPTRRFDGARARSVVVQGVVGPGVVVVVQIAGQNAPEVGLVEHNHVVQTLPVPSTKTPRALTRGLSVHSALKSYFPGAGVGAVTDSG